MKHNNHLDGKSYSYDAPPVKVILNDSPEPDPTGKPTDDDSSSKGNIISFNSYYWLLLILIMI